MIDRPTHAQSPSTRRLRVIITVSAVMAALAIVTVPVQAQDALPMPEDTGPLEPGTYIDAALGVDLTLTVPEGWQIANGSVEGVGVDLAPLGFVPAGPEGVAFVGFTRFNGEVFDGHCVPPGGDEGAFLEERVAIENSAQGLIDHLVANPYLTTTEPMAVEIGGHSGLRIDAAASVPESECASPESHLWAIPVFGSWVLIDGMAAQYSVIDVDGNVVVIVLERSPDVDVEAFTAQAQPLLDSLVLAAPSE